MAQDTSNTGVFRPRDRNQWIRLRTLTGLRWVAICGQLLAIAIADSQFGIQVDLGLCTLAIGAAICMNIVSPLIYPDNKRLTEAQAVWMLLFDLQQLTFLVALTGGLHNPFALLVLTPVVISATALSVGSTISLGVAGIGAVSVMAFWYAPLQLEDGTVLSLPDISLFGFWAAIVIGVAFLSVYAGRVTAEMNSMYDALWATQSALAREQKLTDLDGVVAAAAHELGTPLATIKLTSSELVEDLPEGSDQHSDALLIREQADRCRDILRSMGRAGKDDKHMHQVLLETLVNDAAQPHIARGKNIHFDFRALPGAMRQPTVVRSPEIIHGLRNLIQNAVDFSESSVWLIGRWNVDIIQLYIMDDGPGFSASDIARIGDPFMRRRKSADRPHRRPEYEGMGLGLFIAKTLLERSGAELTFVNAPEGDALPDGFPKTSGALVTVVWPTKMIQRLSPEEEAGLGENLPFDSELP